MESEMELLNKIDKRLALAEQDLLDLAGLKKLFWTILMVILTQGGFVIYGYAQAMYKLDTINVSSLEMKITNAYSIIAGYNDDLILIRTEHSRIRGNIDDYQSDLADLRKKIDTQTNDRFYRSDGDRLESRITRIEGIIFLNGKTPQRGL